MFLIFVHLTTLARLSSSAAATSTVDPSECINDLYSDYGGDFDYATYHDLSEIHAYLDYLVSRNPQSASSRSVGASYLGRDMRLVSVCRRSAEEECGRKHSMLVDAGRHGDEWAGPAAAAYLLQELMEAEEGMAAGLDWHVLVSANPDGYEYSRSDPSAADWSKNLSPNVGPPHSHTPPPHSPLRRDDDDELGDDDGCLGTDLSRNFAWGWDAAVSEEDGPDVLDPCGGEYRGDYGFSEPESRNVAQFVLELLGGGTNGHVVLYSTLHAGTQGGGSVQTPYGYRADKFVPDTVAELAAEGALAMTAVAGFHYANGTTVELEGGLRGGSPIDWAMDTGRTEFAYKLELGRREMLPTGQICAAAKEALAFHRVAADRVFETVGLPNEAAGSHADACWALAVLLALSSSLSITCDI